MNHEKVKRVRYLRALEKFSQNIIRNLKRDDYNEAKFVELVKKNYENLQKVEPSFLDQPYSKALCEFANLAANSTDRYLLLKEANILDKLKNNKSYKKQKHKKENFDE